MLKGFKLVRRKHAYARTMKASVDADSYDL